MMSRIYLKNNKHIRDIKLTYTFSGKEELEHFKMF